MAPIPTRDAVAGRYKNNSGDDFFQFLDEKGEIISWIDASGTPQGKLNQVIGSIPNTIDTGTF